MNDIELSKEDIGVEETITPSPTVGEAPVPPEESTPSPAPSLADAQRTPVPPCGIFEALARAQAGFRKVIKNRVNPAFKSRYADLEAILDAVRPSLNAQGIFISQDVENEPGAVSCLTILTSRDGARVSGGKITIPLPKDSRNAAQALGSAITYARRYSLSAVLSISSDDDDDGNAVQAGAAEAPAPSISPAEVERLDRIAQQGIAAYSEAWKAMTASQKKELQKSGWHDELKRRASVADQAIKEA